MVGTVGTVAGEGRGFPRGSLDPQAASPRPEGPDSMKVRPLLSRASEGPLGCPAESTPHPVFAHVFTCMPVHARAYLLLLLKIPQSTHPAKFQPYQPDIVHYAEP